MPKIGKMLVEGSIKPLAYETHVKAVLRICCTDAKQLLQATNAQKRHQVHTDPCTCQAHGLDRRVDQALTRFDQIVTWS